jgi:hypothetical protein
VTDPDRPEPAPRLSIVTGGTPTTVEVAALVAALRRGEPAPAATDGPSAWQRAALREGTSPWAPRPTVQASGWSMP